MKWSRRTHGFLALTLVWEWCNPRMGRRSFGFESQTGILAGVAVCESCLSTQEIMMGKDHIALQRVTRVSDTVPKGGPWRGLVSKCVISWVFWLLVVESKLSYHQPLLKLIVFEVRLGGQWVLTLLEVKLGGLVRD
jgi:hypothetical protein